VKFEQMQLAAGAAVVEEKKFEELRSGARREMRTGQARQLAAQRVAAETKGKAQTVRMTNVKAGKREKKDFLKAFDEKVRASVARRHLCNRCRNAFACFVFCYRDGLIFISFDFI
jgi:hypothetical protein